MLRVTLGAPLDVDKVSRNNNLAQNIQLYVTESSEFDRIIHKNEAEIEKQRASGCIGEPFPPPSMLWRRVLPFSQVVCRVIS
jgi:hypothetical protein